MEQKNLTTPNSPDSGFFLKELIERYIAQWKWFVLSLGIALALAFFYLRYSIPTYRAAISILVKDERKGGVANELSAFQDLGVLANIKNNVDNEIEVLRSRRMIEATILEMGLYITYINEGRLKSDEIYKNRNIDIIFSNLQENFFKKEKSFVVKSISDTTYGLLGSNDKIKVYKYGQLISTNFCNFKVVRRNDIETDPDSITTDFRTLVKINPLSRVVDSYRSRLNIALLNKNTSVIELSIVDPVKERAEDFLNTLYHIYTQDELDGKKQVSENTSRFIQERLNLMARALEGVEKESEDYKKQKGVTDIKSEAGLYLENSSSFQKEVMDAEIQLKIVNSVIEFARSNNKYNLFPTNVINSDENYSSLIDQYNQLILERNRLLLYAKPGNPVLIGVEARIDALNSNILSSLARLKSSLDIKKKDLERQQAIVSSKISQIPTQEREVRVLARQQQIKEALYLYLLQKGEEIAISIALTAPNAKLIDAALASRTPVSPNKRMVYIIALLAGFMLPFLTIYMVDLLDTKVRTRRDLERKFIMPFLGDVPKSASRGENLTATSRSSLAESLRIIRTNLDFMVNHVPAGIGKTVFITSTFPKEGKTFLSVNISKAIALTGKKVLLVGMDLRNPRLSSYFDVPQEGITSFLASDERNIDKYIVKLDGFKDLYVLNSGIIPPNPAELIMTEKLGQMFEKFRKEYDYIIVDTVPLSIVTDTLLIAKYADAFVYVVRANYLDKRHLNYLEDTYSEKRLPHLALLLNYTDNARAYGYGPDFEKKSWLRKLFSKS